MIKKVIRKISELSLEVSIALMRFYGKLDGKRLLYKIEAKEDGFNVDFKFI